MKTITIEIPDGKKAEWIDGVLTLVDDKPQEPNEQIPTFADAYKFLTEQNMLKVQACKKAEEISVLLKQINPNNIKALIAYNKLCTIAQAWNKADGFEPDFSNTSQYKYFPWFEYSRDAAGFVCTSTINRAASGHADVGSRLFFKTRERAMQFGEQFVDLWNEFLK